MAQKIGFMGLGIMGSAMAGNLLKAGFPVTVYNRSRDKSEILAGQGAKAAAHPRELTENSEVIIAMVTGPEALEELIWGADGAAEAFTTEKVFINMSTVSPRYLRELAQEVEPTGIRFIDAPVSGTKQPAEQGTLVILAGGRQETIKELEPVFLAMGQKVIYCGEVGQGSMMKMFINLLVGVMMEGLAEIINFGRLGGLTLEAMLETVFSGAMNSPMFQLKAANLEKKEYPAAFPLKHLAKDLKFIVDTAYDLKAPVPTALTLLQLFEVGVARGWGDEDISAIARVLEHMGPEN